MLTMVEAYIIREEKMTMCFDSPVSIETYSNHPTRKEFHERWDDSDRGAMGK